MDLQEEKRLVERARKDTASFGFLFDAHYQKIYGYVLRRTADPAVAQDITSEVFYKALKNLWQFRWRSIPFSAWLYRIAGNEVNYYFRAGARRKTTSLDQLVEDTALEIADPHNLIEELNEAEAQIERHQQFLVLQKEIAQLPAKYQEVIALRFFERKKLNEIGEILSKKEGTIKSLLSRGLEMLRQRTEESSTQPSANPSIMNSEGRIISKPKEIL